MNNLVTFLTTTGGIPQVDLTYDLADVANSVSSWFGSFWMIIAFAAAIPLAFMIAFRIKNLFIS